MAGFLLKFQVKKYSLSSLFVNDPYALFGYSCIHLKPCVLGVVWYGIFKFSLNSISNHSNTHSLRCIHGYPYKLLVNL
jgi:hypothetical protein